MNDKSKSTKHYQFGKFNAHTIIETVAKHILQQQFLSCW